MESFNKNVKNAATTLSKQATEIADKIELDKKVADAKKTVEEFAKEQNLDVKYEEAKKAVNETVSNVKSGIEAGKEEAHKEEEEEEEEEIKEENNKVTAGGKEDEGKEIEERTKEEKGGSVTNTKIEKEDFPGDVTLEYLKKEVESIADRIETETNNLAEKEEVQKVLTTLMAKLAVAKTKFVSMTQKNNNRKKEEDEEEELGVEVELGKEKDAKVIAENENENENAAAAAAATMKTSEEKDRSLSNNNDDDDDDDKLSSQYAGDEVVSCAKKAVKIALEKAEAALKKTADKFGIHVLQNEDGSVEMSI